VVGIVLIPGNFLGNAFFRNEIASPLLDARLNFEQFARKRY
jgi:hypothetical protein